MGSVQIYTNTSSAHFATTTGNPDGTRLVSAVVAAADTPAAHLPRSTKPDSAAFPNSLFIGSSLNYLRIKLLTTGNASLSGVPQFYVFGWSREATSGWWEARLLTSLKPGTAAIGTTNTVNFSGLGTVREIFQLGTIASPGEPNAIPHRGDARLYQGFASSGGGHFLVDTIGTEIVEIHFTQATAANQFAALCAGL